MAGQQWGKFLSKEDNHRKDANKHRPTWSVCVNCCLVIIVNVININSGHLAASVYRQCKTFFSVSATTRAVAIRLLFSRRPGSVAIDYCTSGLLSPVTCCCTIWYVWASRTTTADRQQLHSNVTETYPSSRKLGGHLRRLILRRPAGRLMRRLTGWVCRSDDAALRSSVDYISLHIHDSTSSRCSSCFVAAHAIFL